jgi:hypothetical protein
VRKGTILFLLVVSVAVGPTASLAASTPTAANGRITLRGSEILKEPHVTNGGLAGTNGRFTITGAITDKGRLIDYRTQKGKTAWVRRVAIGRKGTITFRITINLNTGSEPWQIVSGTKAYRGLHGTGNQVVDTWYTSPATFVMKGTVSH